MNRPGRRLPAAIITALRSHQSIPSKRTPEATAPGVGEWAPDCFTCSDTQKIWVRDYQDCEQEVACPVCEEEAGLEAEAHYQLERQAQGE